MAVNGTNMGLVQWNLAGDYFNFVTLADNFAKVDQHNHAPGNGAQIPTAGLANGAITQAKIGSAAVGTSQIQDGSITLAKMGSGSVGTSQLASSAVTATQLANGAVTPAKLQGSPSLAAGQMPQWNGSAFVGGSPTGVLFSTAGLRPVPGISGRQHYATDTGDLSYDTGSTWLPLAATASAELGLGSTISTGTLPLPSVTTSGPAMFSRVSSNTVMEFALAGLYRVTFRMQKTGTDAGWTWAANSNSGNVLAGAAGQYTVDDGGSFVIRFATSGGQVSFGLAPSGASSDTFRLASMFIERVSS